MQCRLLKSLPNMQSVYEQKAGNHKKIELRYEEMCPQGVHMHHVNMPI